MIEIMHPEYTKEMRTLFPIFIIIWIIVYIIPIVILIKDPYNIIGILLLLFFIVINLFWIPFYFFVFQISTIFDTNIIILKSLKRKVSIPYEDIKYFEDKGYITLITDNKNYKISTNYPDIKERIITELINKRIKLKG